MPKRKVAVALSEWLVTELDDVAGSSLRSRSALVEEAVTEYVVRRRALEHDARFERRAATALVDMERFATEYDADPRTALEPASLEKLRMLRASGRGFGT